MTSRTLKNITTVYYQTQFPKSKAKNENETRAFAHTSLLVTLSYIIVGMIFIMVVLGGYTRLTGSGLSMVDWRPLTGFLPPLTETQWMDVFSLYQSSPEYQFKNMGMDLQGFKSIFWLEYIHRLWGRLIGIMAFVPILICLLKPNLKMWAPRFFGLWCLGAAQGVMGWYMVKSGLVDDPEVSPYRLCAHLLLAFTTVLCFVWTIQNLKQSPKKKQSFLKALSAPGEGIVFTCLLLTIIYGAFVAGMKAGLIYNSFPLMGSSLIPDEAFFHNPWYTNFFINSATVQFTHRIFAITTLMVVIMYAIKTLKQCKRSKKVRFWVFCLKAAICVQIILGITTLLSHVQIDLAVMHQLTALIVACCFVCTIHAKQYAMR